MTDLPGDRADMVSGCPAPRPSAHVRSVAAEVAADAATDLAVDLAQGRPDAVVVGSGIVGLTAALRLQATGRRVAIVTADDLPATTSWVAAAVWFPTRVAPRDRVVGWGTRSLEVMTETARDHRDAGVLLRETVSLYRDPPGRPWWTAAVPDVRDATPAELPAGYPHGLVFTVPLAHVAVYLPWLRDRFHAAGGTTHRHRLHDLAALTGVAPLVVDCAGLGARDLVPDPTVTPLRGQVVRTTNPGLDVSYRDEHHPDGYTYVHPRTDDCILGGTVEETDDTAPDQEVTAAILRRCRTVEPRLEDARILDVAVGLRPARPQVRLERDDGAIPGSAVVHDYGHGGAGVTLAWGCADEVVALAER